MYIEVIIEEEIDGVRTGLRVEWSLKLSSKTADCSLVSLSFFLGLPSSSRSRPDTLEGLLTLFSTSRSRSSPTKSLFSLLMLEELEKEDAALGEEEEAIAWKL